MPVHVFGKVGVVTLAEQLGQPQVAILGCVLAAGLVALISALKAAFVSATVPESP